MITAILAALIAQVAAAGSPAPAPASVGDPIRLTTATGLIRGMLTVPARAGKVPIALIIAGSGPTDRNGNSPLLPGKNDAYKMQIHADTSISDPWKRIYPVTEGYLVRRVRAPVIS